MRMGEMFTSSANFSGIIESSEPLQVSKIVHKAFIEINEQGSEAASASAG